MHEGEVHEAVNNMWRWEIKDHGGKKAQKLRREKSLRGEIKGAESAKGAT